MMVTLNLLAVFLFGVIIGFTELLQRYREIKYTFNWKDNVIFYTILYIAINGIVSIVALFLLKYFRGQNVLALDSFEIQNIIIAGIGGMMILRSSIYSIKIKDKQIDIGFGILFQTFLDVVERKIKNGAAASRICKIHELMRNVNFVSAKYELPTLCIEFIDNFTEEDSNNLNKKIAKIDGYNIMNINKSMQLGRAIAFYCDEEILKRAINKLPHIVQSPNNTEPNIDEFEKHKLKLIKKYGNE
ncbi:MAG: hypothetical protein IPM69_13645 [Ignavibacteria bacterium]|nr:hypothetical protein [Ignavibacteria bacterium]